MNKSGQTSITSTFDWDGIDKTDMYMVDQIAAPEKINFYDIIVNPDYHYYFFGIKLIDLNYDLKYRAIRRFPKNVADLILVKNKIDIKLGSQSIRNDQKES